MLRQPARRAWCVCLIEISLTALTVAAGLEPGSIRVTQYADAVVVYVEGLDMLRRGHRGLHAEVRIAGQDGVCKVDLSAEYQSPAILIEKAKQAPCSRVSVTVRTGDSVIFKGDLETGAVTTVASRFAASSGVAAIEPGQFMGEAPQIPLPDLAQLPVATLMQARRKIAFATTARKVECDVNWPLISAKNNVALSRQTDRPDDASKRSLYVPLKSQLYDAETGRPTRVAHFLIEVPLDAAWLKGKGDADIVVPPEKLKIYWADETWPPGGKGQWITGQGAGGLGQGSGTVTLDDAGNIYYSAVPPTVVRFNVHTGRWETPPLDFMPFFNQHLPAKDEGPETIRGLKAMWDSYKMIAYGNGRIYIMPVRNGVYGITLWNGVFSIPVAHWNDPEKFRAGIEFLVGCWPTATHSLYPDWPVKGDAGRKLSANMLFHDNTLYLTSYPGAHGGPWRLTVDEDGRAVAFTESAGGYAERKRASQAAATERRVPRISRAHVDWWNYGVIETTRAGLGCALSAGSSKGKSRIRIYYDAIAVMRRRPELFAKILASLSGPSLAPCYMATHIPGRPGHVLGVGEYGYYLADLDLAAGTTIPKRYLPLDLGHTDVALPLRVGLGPYGHTWIREGEKLCLYIGGYIGYTRLLYGVGGEPLPKFRMETLALHSVALDKGQPGGIKRARHLLPGLDDRVFLTGTHTAARAGTAWSGGLMSFRTDELKTMERLSDMSRTYSVGYLCDRVVYRPDGTPVQQFALAGKGVVEGYVQKMKDKERVPSNRDAKVFLYDYASGGRPRDILGFSLPARDGETSIGGQAFSRDRRYLVIHTGNALLTFDIATRRFIDGLTLPAGLVRFSKPDHRLIRAPDDRLMVYILSEKEDAGTFYEVAVSPEGTPSLQPLLTLTGSPGSLRPTSGAVIAFTPMPGQDDGSYTLFIGPYWRRQGTTAWVIRDFIPPRTG